MFLAKRLYPHTRLHNIINVHRSENIKSYKNTFKTLLRIAG
jgi:hypothetical protein